MGDRRLGELVGGGAGGVELAQQRGELDAHRVLDLRRLVQVGVGEDLAQPLDVAVEVALAAGLDQQPAQPGGGQLARPGPGWVRRPGWCGRRGGPAHRSGSSANATSAAG